jgi:hypothetical protein
MGEGDENVTLTVNVESVIWMLTVNYHIISSGYQVLMFNKIMFSVSSVITV